MNIQVGIKGKDGFTTLNPSDLDTLDKGEVNVLIVNRFDFAEQAAAMEVAQSVKAALDLKGEPEERRYRKDGKPYIKVSNSEPTPTASEWLAALK